MKRLHTFCGVLITVFVLLHISNHMAGFWGAEAHIKIMDSLRLLYRNRFTEFVLLLAVLVQIITGLRFVAVNRKSEGVFFYKLQQWSGLYLAFFLIIHIVAVLCGRFLLKLDTNFYFGAAGLNTFPLNLFFIPYYGLAILAFFSHIAAVHARKIERTVFGFTVKQQSFFIIATGFVVMLLVFYALTNGFQGVVIPEKYKLLTAV